MIVAPQIQKRARQRNFHEERPTRRRALQPPAGNIHAALLSTGWGLCGIVWSGEHERESSGETAFAERPRDATLCRIVTPGLAIDELRSRLLNAHPGCSEVIADRARNFHPEIVPTWFPELARRLQGYYSTGVHGPVRPDFADSWHLWKWRLKWSLLTPFQRAVLEITATIPRSKRMTYGDVARAVGKPRATRAVGAALGANPWPVLIPCHRVVGSNGAMIGFSAPGGVGVKERMLAMEAHG